MNSQVGCLIYNRTTFASTQIVFVHFIIFHTFDPLMPRHGRTRADQSVKKFYIFLLDLPTPIEANDRCHRP